MVELVGLVTLVTAVLASAVMAWVIGAGSSGATPFAPAVGANAISVMRAGLVVGVLGFLGAALQGASVSEAVGGELIRGTALPAEGVIVALVIGAGLMLVGIFTGYPIATAFTVTGAVIGVGLAVGGDPAWAKYREIAALWVLTPPLGAGVAFGIASVLPREDVPEAVSVPLLTAGVAAIVANVRFTVLGPGDASASIASVVASAVAGGFPIAGLPARIGVTVLIAAMVGVAVRRGVLRDERGALDRVLLALGSLVAFSAGGSQVGLAVGPLLPLLDGGGVPLTYVLVGGGVGILVGSWTGAPRMIKALARDYASLGPRRSISALVSSFTIAQLAILLGVPISFNEIVVSSIVGAGLAVGGTEAADRTKLAWTAAAWVGSFVLALAVGYGAMVLFGAAV